MGFSLGPASSNPAAPLPAAPPDDRGVFVLSLAGKKIGTEKFEIHASGDSIVAQAEIELRVEQDGTNVELQSSPRLVLNRKFEPQTYSWAQKGAQSSRLEIDFRKPPARCRYWTLTGQEDDRDFGLPPDVVVLDENVIHHYALVLDRLDPASTGLQAFKAFVPQEAAPGVVTVQDLGDGKAGLRHLLVTTELTRIELWVDAGSRLERLLIPETRFEAQRRK